MNQPGICKKGCETCGRWYVTPEDCGQDCFKGDRWVAQHHAREDVPKLIAEIRRLKEKGGK